MKMRLALLIGIMAAIGGLALLVMRQAAPPGVEIELKSAPFPMGVGPSRLFIALRQTDGTPIEGARLRVDSEMMHHGMLPIVSQPQETSGGEYSVQITWPMTGQWNVWVTAELPDQRRTVQEQFSLFIYPIPPRHNSPQFTYRSVREVNAVVAANPDKELWVVIPQGTRAMLVAGEGADLIPAEIRLQVSGQNVLNIRNDDIADHTIGPFYVRAGETIRQEFTQPATFVGTCSVRYSAEISIIVEA